METRELPPNLQIDPTTFDPSSIACNATGEDGPAVASLQLPIGSNLLAKVIRCFVQL